MIFKIAITGGTSSGKSFISKIFCEKLNCLVFDADKIVEEIYKDHYFCYISFINHERFSLLLNESKTLCKKKIKKMIIENDSILNELCEIIYPELKKRIFSIFEERQEDKYIIFEVPLLFESEFDKFFNFIININSDEDLQLKRSLDKKIDEKLHRIFVARQLNNDIKNQKSHFIIMNNEDLEKQIDECIKLIEVFNTSLLQ